MKKYLIITVLLICASLLNAQQPELKKTDRLMELKKNYFEGKYKDATLNYLNREDSVNAEEAYYLGLSHLSLYNYDSAVDYFRKASEKEPLNTGYEYQLAKTCQLVGLIPEAENHFNNILKRDPGYAPALFDSGTLDFNMKRYEDAIRKFKTVIKGAPANFMAFYNLAKCYSNLEPFNAYTDSVELYLSVAVSINRKYLPALEMLGNLHFGRKIYDQAYILFMAGFEANPAGSNFLYSAGLCREKQQEYEKAIDLFSRAIAINGKEAPYWDHLGYSSFYLNKYSDAVAAYKKAVELDEESASYRVNLAYAYVRTDSIDKGIESFKSAITKLQPENIGQVYLQMGHVYYEKKNYPEAVKAYKEALNYIPANIEAHYLGAISEDELKNYTSALAGYKKALQLIKESIPGGELASNERYNTIRKRIADLSKNMKKGKR